MLMSGLKGAPGECVFQPAGMLFRACSLLLLFLKCAKDTAAEIDDRTTEWASPIVRWARHFLGSALGD